MNLIDSALLFHAPFCHNPAFMSEKAEKMEPIKHIIRPELSGKNIDLALSALEPKTSRRSIRRALDTGKVSVNGKIIRYASTKVKTKDLISCWLIPQKKQKTPSAPYEFILFENEDLIVINKPAKILSQPSLDKKRPHVTSFLRKQYPKKYPELHLIHRLDFETSGCLLVAKNKKACEYYMELFKQQTIQKTYHAISTASQEPKGFVIKNHLSTFKQGTSIKSVQSGGKVAETHFQCLKHQRGMALMECQPKTGRSHQIRVHLAEKGLPIIGDKLYSKSVTKMSLELDRQLLHAYKISFREMKSGKNMEVTAKWPDEFKRLFSNWK